MFESIIKSNLIHYLNTKSCFSAGQHGFMTGASTATNLIESLNILKRGFQSKCCNRIVYFDFAKAFDSVSYSKLIFKLSHLGLPNNLIKTINSFLVDRTQRVCIDNILSEALPLISGVPQGSVLGPVLFLIYINDLTKVLSPDCISKLFADDLKLFHVFNCAADFVSLQSNVDAVWKWSVDWQLPISVKKCSVVDYGKTSCDLTLLLNNQKLPTLAGVTDLGIVFTDSLSFSNHIVYIVNRAKIRCNMLYRCFVTKQIHFLVKGFTTYIRPVLEYCSQVWSPTKRADIDRLESVQRNFTKRLPGFKNMAYADRLVALGLHSLEERRLRLDLVFCFNILHAFNCVIPTDIGLVLAASSTRGHVLKLSVMHANVTLRVNFFANRIVGVWNALPSYVIESEHTTTFKRNLDKVDLSSFVTQF